MNAATEKLYYSEPTALTIDTPWRREIEVNKLILQISPAYPEGGGQIGDSGIIEQNGVSLRFTDTQKTGPGRTIIRQDFPVISVDHQISLTLAESVPTSFDESKPIIVKVDMDRRTMLSRSHTGAHLLWLALTERFGNLYPVVRGCHIVEGGGRFDLLIDRPTDQDLKDAEVFIQHWVSENFPIEMRQLPSEPECRIWSSNGRDIPCGGTHLASCAAVGAVRLRVKSKGKSGFRVIYEFYES